MQATAVSRRNSRNSNAKLSNPQELSLIVSHITQEQRNISRWPASRFAPSRKPRVIG